MKFKKLGKQNSTAALWLKISQSNKHIDLVYQADDFAGASFSLSLCPGPG